jgi:alcohol dehydrogenase class IV
VVGFYREAAPAAMARIAGALDADDAETGLRDLARDLDLGGGLADLGLRRADLDLAADLAAAVAPQTPAPIDRAQIHELLGNAFVNGNNGTGEGNG